MAPGAGFSTPIHLVASTREGQPSAGEARPSQTTAHRRRAVLPDSLRRQGPRGSTVTGCVRPRRGRRAVLAVASQLIARRGFISRRLDPPEVEVPALLLVLDFRSEGQLR